MTRNDSRRALLLHGGALGDCVLAFHLARRLVSEPPEDLFVCARSSAHRWLARRRLIAHSAFADDCGVTSLFSDRPKLSPDLCNWMASGGLIINMLGPPGGQVERNLKGQFGQRVLSVESQPDGSVRHIVDQWADQLRVAVSELGVQIAAPAPVRFSTRPRDRIRVDSRNTTAAGPRPEVIIHPGGGGVQKHAPLEWFESVAVRLMSMGCPTAWMIGPDEAQRDGPQLRDRLERTAPLILEPDICVAADLVARAKVFVGNDSGMAHVAALCGIRSIIWYGPTNSKVWRPVGPDVQTLLETDQDSFVMRVMQLIDAVDGRDD